MRGIMDQNQPIPKLNGERYLWLQSQLQTDLLALDEEVARIGMLVKDANENAAIAAEFRDSEKERLAVVRARVTSASRETLRPDGKAKTETQIEAELPLSPEYQKAQAEYSDARLDAALWASMASGFSTKAFSLTQAVTLIQMGYITQDSIIAKRREGMRKAAPQFV
jgi:hypothetical protein